MVNGVKSIGIISGSSNNASSSGGSSGGGGSSSSGNRSSNYSAPKTTKWVLQNPNGTPSSINGQNSFKSKEAAQAAIDKNPLARKYGVTAVPSYDTGGYTGDWNTKDGKIGILHEKELILNKDDTKNILDTVSIVRTLGNLINGTISKLTSGISSGLAGITGIKTTNNTNQNNNQKFIINAEFPNANSVTEIQDAILGLPNLASQWLDAQRI